MGTTKGPRVAAKQVPVSAKRVGHVAPAAGAAAKLAPKKGPAVVAASTDKSRQKLIRDSFTMPKADIDLIATLKARALAGGRAAKKSELLRAGLHALAALKGAALVKALDALQAVKVGRPKRG